MSCIINNDKSIDVNEDPEGVSNIFNEFIFNIGKSLSMNFSNLSKNNCKS
jgi:hypothetical protein